MRIHKDEKGIMKIRKTGSQQINTENTVIRNKGRISKDPGYSFDSPRNISESRVPESRVQSNRSSNVSDNNSYNRQSTRYDSTSGSVKNTESQSSVSKLQRGQETYKNLGRQDDSFTDRNNDISGKRPQTSTRPQKGQFTDAKAQRGQETYKRLGKQQDSFDTSIGREKDISGKRQLTSIRTQKGQETYKRLGKQQGSFDTYLGGERYIENSTRLQTNTRTQKGQETYRRIGKQQGAINDPKIQKAEKTYGKAEPLKEGLRAEKDYMLEGSGEAGHNTNEAVSYGIEKPAKAGTETYRFTKDRIEGRRIRRENKTLKREIRNKESALYEDFAASRGNKQAVKKINKRIKKNTRTKYNKLKVKAGRGAFLKGAFFRGRVRLVDGLKGKLFNKNSGDSSQRATMEMMSFGSSVFGRTGSMIMRLILARLSRRFILLIIGFAALASIMFAVPFAILATPFGIFFYQGRSETEQKNPDDILRDFYNHQGTQIQGVAANGHRTITEEIPVEITEEIEDENGDIQTVTRIEYETRVTTENITSDVIYDFNGEGTSNFYDVLATFSVIYARREGAFANWEEDGNHEPEVDENGNLTFDSSPAGTTLMGKLMTSAITYKQEVRTIEEAHRKEEYTVVSVRLKNWQEIVQELPSMNWSNKQLTEFLYPPETSEDYRTGNNFIPLTAEEVEQLKEIYEELKQDGDAPMLPGTISGYGDVLDPNATTIDDGSATPAQLTIANNARNNNGNFPATYGWCAAWVGGIYGKSIGRTPHGNAIDYWVNWGKPEQASKTNVPIGAAVITTGDPNWGHIGIYIGDGLVASNLGGVKIEPLATFGNNAPVYTGYQTSMRGKQGYLGWVWPDGIALGPTPQNSSAEGWKKGIASAYGGWSDAQIHDNMVTATGDAVTETSMGVAVPMAWANYSSYYGHKVLIRYNGKTVTATINDCGGMDGGKRVLDLQPGVFKAFGATSCDNWGLREVEYKIL